MKHSNVPVMRQTWPDRREWNLVETARRLGLDTELTDLNSAWEGLKAFERSQIPVIGVMGLMNAGKSSFVQSLLSPEGARRVLCGEWATEATQRFVFWLPSQWQSEPSMINALLAEMESIFGASSQFLPLDEREAHKQYNGDSGAGNTFSTPLLAFDPRLDQLGIGLLDCPDIERPHPSHEGGRTAAIRLDFLRRAARIMSGVVLIADRGKVAMDSVRFLTDKNLGLHDKPRFLLINFFRPKDGTNTVHDLLHDAAVLRVMREFQVTELYAAYNYIPQKFQRLIPSAAQEMGFPKETPVFFQVDPAPERNIADTVAPDRLIQSRLLRIDPADLWANGIRAKRDQVVANLEQLRASVAAEIRERREAVRRTRAGLLELLRGIAAPDNELRFPITRGIAAQLEQTIRDTAPFWAKPAMLAGDVSRKGVKSARSSLQWIRGTTRLLRTPGQEAANELRRKSKEILEPRKGGSLFDAQELARRSRNCRFMPGNVPQADQVQAWSAVLEAVLDVDVALPKEQLENVGKEIWIKVPTIKKMFAAASGPVLLLGSLSAVLFFPFDAGGTAVLFSASVPELLAALGLGAVASHLGGTQLERLLREHVTQTAYQRLLQSSLDVFQLPRFEPSTGSGPHVEPPSAILTDRFANLGQVRIDLQSPDGPPLKPVLPLLPDAFLAEEITEGWEALLHEAQTPSGTTKG